MLGAAHLEGRLQKYSKIEIEMIFCRIVAGA